MSTATLESPQAEKTQYRKGDIILFKRDKADTIKTRARVLQVISPTILKVNPLDTGNPDEPDVCIVIDDSVVLLERASTAGIEEAAPESPDAAETILPVEDFRILLGETVLIALELIDPNPYQPRLHFDEKEQVEMETSLDTWGVLQNPTARPHPTVPGRVQIIEGERRKRGVAALAEKQRWALQDTQGRPAMKITLRAAGDMDMLEMAVEANLRRIDNDPVEKALAFQRMMEMGRTQEQIAAKYGLSQAVISNQVRLLGLPEKVREMLSSKLLSASHGVMLLSLDNNADIEAYATRAVEGDWSVKKLEEAVREWKKAHEQPDLFAAASSTGEAPETQGAPQPVDDIENDKRLLIAVLDSDLRLCGAVSHSAGLDMWRSDRAMNALVAEGKTRREGDRWALIPSSALPTESEEEDENSNAGAAPVEAAEGQAERGSENEGQDSPERLASGTTEAQSPTIEPNDDPAGLRSGDTQANNAATAAREAEPATAPQPGAAPLNTPMSGAEASSGTSSSSGKASGTGASSAGSTVTPKAEDKTAASGSRVSRPGHTWLEVPSKELFACQDAGLTVEAIFETVARLIEIGEGKGLDVDDLLTTIDAYINGDDEAAASEDKSADGNTNNRIGDNAEESEN